MSKQIERGQFRGENGEEKIIRVLREIAATFSFIHSLRVVHRDLKPRNVLIDRRGRTQICDFGVAQRYVVRVSHPIVTKKRLTHTQVLENTQKFCSSGETFMYEYEPHGR